MFVSIRLFRMCVTFCEGDCGFVRDLGQLTGSRSYCLDDSSVNIHIAELLGEKVVGFLVQVTCFRKVQGNKILIEAAVLVKKREIFGDASSHAIDNSLVMPGR